MYYETAARSIIKTVSWRFWATLTTASLVLFFTGQTELALTVGGLEVIIKMVIYFFHERTWDKISLGRKEIEPVVVLFTGLPNCGKTRLAARVAEILSERKLRVEHLSGQSMREILPRVGFSRAAREKHIQRVGFLASRLESHGIYVCASFVAPFEESRSFVRQLCKRFIEVHVSTPLEQCEAQDESGLYARARRGDIEDFTGVSAPYEAPKRPEIAVDLCEVELEEAAQLVVSVAERSKALELDAESSDSLPLA